MVDKVDRPEAPRTWAVKETAASQDRGQEQERQEQGGAEDEFSSPGTPSEWHKFNSNEGTREMLHIGRERIKHFWFHKAHLQRQTALIEGNLELTNGKLFEHVQILLPRFDDYFRVKGYQMGQEVPLLTLIHEPTIDVSIPLKRRTVAAPKTAASPAADPQTQAAPWWARLNWNDPKVKYIALLLYSLVFVGLITFVMAVL